MTCMFCQSLMKTAALDFQPADQTVIILFDCPGCGAEALDESDQVTAWRRPPTE